jgi:hypothetical protein
MGRAVGGPWGPQGVLKVAGGLGVAAMGAGSGAAAVAAAVADAAGDVMAAGAVGRVGRGVAGPAVLLELQQQQAGCV